MNRDRIEDSWRQLAGSVKRRWSQLVDEQLDLWAGKRDHPKPVARRQARQQEIEPPK
jgi:uncharacterized protein YjbJ (UPF0337 family)